MKKVRIYYVAIWHGERVSEKKSKNWNDILNFVFLNKKGATGACHGSILVPEDRVEHCLKNFPATDLYEWKVSKKRKEKK